MNFGMKSCRHNCVSVQIFDHNWKLDDVPTAYSVLFNHTTRWPGGKVSASGSDVSKFETRFRSRAVGNTSRSPPQAQPVEWVGLEMGTKVSNHSILSTLLRLSPLKEPSPRDFGVKTEGGRREGVSFLQAPLKPDLLGRIRHELNSPNLGGHLPHHPTPAVAYIMALGNELWWARIIGPPHRAYILSDLRNSPPLKRSQPPQTDLRRS
ncbi:hypothetical protein AVEN_142739-1 [Araneus ventricosus]|uniref:Uncharacterized protein n=1 Tax=Araneus ventricosus TaxID=182803 RepID=A0A4Y2Q9T5_ARAVE|nr:hypothetical protein AVEN_142739-1 [Araneus ventricosus]